jgi:hypothetical protein
MTHRSISVIVAEAWNKAADKPLFWRIWYCCCLAFFLAVIDLVGALTREK